MQSINDRLRVGMDVASKTYATASSASQLLSRAFILTPTFPNGEQPIPLVDGTRYIVARGVGAGGAFGGAQADIGDAGAGGGAYAKAVFPVASSDVIGFEVGQIGTASDYTSVRLNGQYVFLADGGVEVTGGNSGGGGTVTRSSQYVTVQRNGTAGSSKTGGNAPGDLADPDTLFLTGTGATPSVPATGFGGGTAVERTGVNTFTQYRGTNGVLIIEFWSGVPA